MICDRVKLLFTSIDVFEFEVCAQLFLFSLKHFVRTPSNEELFERFLADLSWRHFRSYVTDGSLEKVSGIDTPRSMSLRNYQVTAALLKTTRGRLSLKAKLKEIWEKHRKTSHIDGEEEEEEVP